MTSPKYKVGDKVFVVGQRGPTKRTVVTAVKDYKRGPKVTCADGSEWDPAHHGHRWGTRGDAYNTGDVLAPYSDKLDTALKLTRSKHRLRRLAEKFDDLTPEQQEELLAVVQKIWKQRKGITSA